MKPPAQPALRLEMLNGDIAPSWQGWTALTPLPDSPVPMQPQGQFSDTAAEPRSEIPDTTAAHSHAPVELMAPAGGPDAAFAAFHFGADAIYVGLNRSREEFV